jgi:chromosome segregation ATPase
MAPQTRNQRRKALLRSKMVMKAKQSNMDPLCQYLALETGALYKKMEEAHANMLRYKERMEAIGARLLQTDAELQERTAERDDLWNQLEDATTTIDRKDTTIRHLRGIILELRSRNLRSNHHRAIVQQWAERMIEGTTTEEDEIGGTPDEEDLRGLDEF